MIRGWVDGAIVFDTGRGMGRKKEGNKDHKTISFK
jgi:hypothetical protein